MCFLIVKITWCWHQSGWGLVLYMLVLNHLLPRWGSQSGHLWAQELNRTTSRILLPSSPPCQAPRWWAAILKKASESFIFRHNAEEHHCTQRCKTNRKCNTITKILYPWYEHIYIKHSQDQWAICHHQLVIRDIVLYLYNKYYICVCL